MIGASARPFRRLWVVLIASMVAIVQPIAASADAVVFTTNATIDAGDTTYEGYDVTVRGCTVTINGPHSFASLLIENAGTVTHTPGYVPGMSLSIAGDMTVRYGGAVNVSACGFGSGLGPGRGQADTSGYAGGGASYGGRGVYAATSQAGAVYGSIREPVDPGSGGGSGGNGRFAGGAGGGCLRLSVSTTLQVDGSIYADGQSGYSGGGGSGGSIYITAGTLAGSGLISAMGGNSYNANGVNYGGSGGGGRIAIYRSASAYSGRITVRGGRCDNYGYAGAGTLYSKEPGQVYGDLVINNDGNAGQPTPLSDHQVFDFVSVNGQGVLAPLPGVPLDLETMGDVVVALDGSISADGQGSGPASGPGAGANDVQGYAGGGASYGGDGSRAQVASAGTPYGSIKEPFALGSGGGMGGFGSFAGGAGGGAIRIVAHGALQVYGRITAHGQSVTSAGGGSGGSIYLTLGTLSGSGIIGAYGGNSYNGNNVDYGGSGGGGRIAICYALNTFTGSISARGGRSESLGWAGAGTVFLRQEGQAQGELLVSNDGNGGGLTRLLAAETFDNVRVFNYGQLSTPRLQTLSMTVLGNLTIEPTGAVTVSGQGFLSGQGPGVGNVSNYGGGAYGGRGKQYRGDWSGTTYGSELLPVDCGSGGAHGSGAGAAYLVVNGTLKVDGGLRADGTSVGDWAGAGAGGSLLIRAGELAGQGAISADGGNAGGAAGPGGGGRIAVYYSVNSYLGTLQAKGGSSGWYGYAEDGSVHLEQTVADYVAVLTLNATALAGGQSTVGVLSLNNPAPDTGIAVQVLSSDPSVVTGPPSVSFAPGETVAQFPVAASSVTAPKTVTITARLWDRTSTAQLTVNPWIAKLMVNPSAAASGDTVAGTLVLSTPAPDGGLLVALAADKPAALTVPASVLVAAGQKVATFDMVAASVTKTTTVAVSASYLAESRAATVYVNPAGAQIKAFVISPASVLGGQSAQGVISLTKRAPASGLNIALTSSDPSGVTVPAYVNIPGDRTSGYFKISTKAGLAAESVVVTATISGAGAGGKAQATLVVRATGIKSLVLSPAAVYGGETAIGLVTLDSTPLAPVVVMVQSDQTVAVPEASIVIPAGQTTGAFFVDTRAVSGRVLATITARANGTQRSKRLTIDPDPGGKRRWRGVP